MDNSSLKEGFLGQKMIVLPKILKKTLRSNALTRSFLITDIGYYPKASNHRRVRSLGSKEYIFIYCTDGAGGFRYNDRSQKILPNQFFIIPKHTKHEYWADSKNPWSIYWMHFDGEGANKLYERYSHHKKMAESVPFESERIALFDRIFQMLQSDYTSSQLEYANVLGLNFISSFVYSEIDQTSKNNNHNNMIDAVIQFLNDNLDKSFKSEDIASEFNYSPSYLFNLFKKRTGYSLLHFFNLKKIQKACEYLKYTNLSVKEISYKMNFQDPLYFSRTFKKYIGVSPRTYRQRQHS